MGTDYRIRGRRIAEEKKIPWNIFNAMITQESGWDPTARNPSGATGLGQLMPGTAQGLGVDPRDPVQNLTGAATYLQQMYDKYGRWDLALAAYNAGPGNVDKYKGIPPFGETQKYVKTIMANAHAVAGGNPAPTPAPAVDPMTAMASAGVGSPMPAPGMSLSAILGSAAPSPRSVGILHNLGGMAEKAAQAAQAEIPLPIPQQQIDPMQPTAGASSDMPGLRGDDWQQWVGTPGHRDGPSAPHTPEILQFVGQVGKLSQTKLTPWPNESHSLTTVNGRPSAHGNGRAADIPASGPELVRIGQSALVAAGADPAWARQQKGGLYNIGGYQVIFNTHKGGDHTDHVHVGLRG